MSFWGRTSTTLSVLQATPNLIAPVGTEARPLAPHRCTIDKAREREGEVGTGREREGEEERGRGGEKESCWTPRPPTPRMQSASLRRRSRGRELVGTPAGPKVQATGMPSHVCMLIQAADRVKANQVDNQTILVSHEKVKSLLDEDGDEFRLEALATLPGMFSFNVRNQTRLAVGAVKFRKDGPVFMANRVFALPDAMTDEEAKNCIAREIENVVKVPE